MIIIRNNPDQLARLLEALKNVAPPETMSKVLTHARMTEHDFSVLVAEVGSDDGVQLDDVFEFITDQPECHDDIMVHVKDSMGDDHFNKFCGDLFKDKTDYRLVKTYQFEELTLEAQEYAIRCYREELTLAVRRKKISPDISVKLDDLRAELESENFLYDQHGSAINEE